MSVEIIGPSSQFFISQRLKLHYVDWGNEELPLLLLVHGGRDHARSFDWVARDLREHFHVVVPDLRGHGDSAHAVGGNYTLPDFVLDLAQLVEALGAEQAAIVGHSLGGSISLHYAGVYPERVSRLVAVEGLGPPPEMLARLRETPAHERTARWVDGMRSLAARVPRRYASIDAAAKRMQEENGFLSPEQAHHLTIHGVARNEDGTFSWKFDNYSRAFGPYRFSEEEVRSLWARITCPTLLVRGSESWAGDPAEDGRIDPFQDAMRVNVDGAGHWVHHDQLDRFLEVVRNFLGVQG